MSYQDKILTCSDCRRPFAFSAEDQQLSGELGFGQAKRCRSCWGAREERRRDGDSSVASSPLSEFRARVVPGAVLIPIAMTD